MFVDENDERDHPQEYEWDGGSFKPYFDRNFSAEQQAQIERWEKEESQDEDS